MKEVILFFPDTKTLADYSALLPSGPAEINSIQLTLKTSLCQEQIADAKQTYQAVPCCAAAWEKLERWLDACRKRPHPKQTRYLGMTTLS